MSESILNAILYSSKEPGVDQKDHTDHDTLFYRLGIVQSDKAPYVVQAIDNLRNFSNTVEPRLRKFMVNDARTFRNMFSSFGSVGGKTLRLINTTQQSHSITQKNVSQKKGLASMFGPQNNNSQSQSSTGE